MSRILSFNHPALSEVAAQEWLVTNGMGGYAASTICGMNTRRYHGLLVASLNPPTERRVLVSRIEETVHLATERYELGSNQYPGTIHPQGYQQVSAFTRDPFPQTTFRFEGAELRKTIFMPYGSNTTVVTYHNPSEVSLEIDLHIHLVNRDYHSLLTQTDGLPYYLETAEDHVSLYAHDGSSPVYVGFSEGQFQEDRAWYYNLEYQKEQERGQDFAEHSFQPGYIRVQLDPGAEIFVVLTLEAHMLAADPATLKAEEAQRIANLVPETVQAPFAQDLIKSADQFLVHRRSTQSATLIAGYPWFTDWGRDTMIAMRGLTIASGKQAEARSIVETFLKYLDQGMLPNRFPDNGETPEYNTVDATLWLFVVLYEYVQQFDDWAFIETVFPQLRQILQAHIEGTRYDIHVNSQGFLFAGNQHTQLTWMDAKMWGHAFTPRWGCAVEINALWYNALRIFQVFAEKLGQPAGASEVLCRKFEKHFQSYFLHPAGYLYDTLMPDEWTDDSFRPNQLYALSLPFPLLDAQTGKKMLDLVADKLLTPYGLRTLAADHPDFKPVYQGKQWDRDSAYHQGTVWPFLLGEYLQAKIQVEGFSDALGIELEGSMEALQHHFYAEGCIHGISEIFDGAEPQQGKGTFHQAWSVSTLLSLILTHGLFENNAVEPNPPVKEVQVAG